MILTAVSFICCVVYSQNFSPRYLLGKKYPKSNLYGAGITAKGKINSWRNISEMLEKIKPETSSRFPPSNLQGAGKNIHVMCTSPWWQLPEITHCSHAALRNTSNPVFETQPFPESSGAVAHCRNHCWMVILPMKVTPDQDKHLNTIVVRQMVSYYCLFQESG